MDCSSAPPPQLLKGIEQFNRREFYECHETLEEIWLGEAEEIRKLYQGILQVGVAFYHLSRGNFRGSTSLMQSGIGYLKLFTPTCMSVNVEKLVDETISCYVQLEGLGRERIREFESANLPHIEFIAGA